MRIEKVALNNINSLYGKFEIDFTHEAYAEGLFAIVGPSGSGKSTVLDAMCLALYGRTPRITVSAEHNEAMNKNADSCSSEVVFVSRNKRYRSTFSQKRAIRAKVPFMKLKNELFEICSDGIQKPLGNNSTEARKNVEEIVGLKYDQFTRSVMLAQFKFAEFLNAKPNDRATILEQVSGTDIYKRISKAAFNKQKLYATTLDEIRIKKETVNVLMPTQVSKIETELMHIDEKIADYEAFENQLLMCGTLMDDMARQQQTLGGYESEKIKVNETKQAQLKLFEADKAAEKTARQAQIDLQKTLKIVRGLDYKIASADKEAGRIGSEADICGKEIKAQKIAILEILKKHLPSAPDAKLKDIYEADNEADIIRAEVKAELNRFEETEQALRKDAQSILQGKDEQVWFDRQEILEKALPVLQAKTTSKTANEELKKLRKEWTVLQTREKSISEQVKEIEKKFLYAKLDEQFGEQRKQLEDGQPCPLCGALKHPSADKAHDTSFLAKVTEERKEILAQKNRIDSDITQINFSVTAQTKVITDNESVLNEGEAIMKDFGDADIAQLQKEIEQIKQRLRDSGELAQKRSIVNADVLALTKQLGEVDKDAQNIKHAKGAIADISERKDAHEKALAASKEERKMLSESRRQLFGEKNADTEETNAAAALTKAEENTSGTRKRMEAAKTDAVRNNNDIERTKKAIGEQQTALKSAYDDAQSKAKIVAAMQDITDSKALHEDVCAKIDDLHSSAQQSKDTMASLVRNLGALSTKQKERKGEARNTLSVNDSKKRELKEIAKDEKKQTKEFKRWSDLSSLIGSADGIKFSRIAQGITFDVLLKYANQSLAKMSDRYILVRDDASHLSPLEINVIDNYQAGDIRPVSNLSGGESFVVSMALALGLSEMSSGKTQIDSLFIDEGFASLDENYLELALQTLSTLGNRENKLIGVISHVKELKERIDTQIEVSALTGGRSTLTGPGVSLG